MKTITSIKELKAEKNRLAKLQQQQEQKIRHSWAGLKESLQPANMAKDTFNSFVNKKINNDNNRESLLKSTLSYGAWLLTRKIIDKTGKRMGRLYSAAKKNN